MERSSSWEKLIEKEVRSRIIHPEYLPREPDESSKRHIQTCIVVMALVLYHFPEIAECFPRYIGMSENFIQDLRNRVSAAQLGSVKSIQNGAPTGSHTC